MSAAERHVLRRTFTKVFDSRDGRRRAERVVRSAFDRLHRELENRPQGCPTIAELRDEFLAALRIGYAAPGRRHRTAAKPATVACHARRLKAFGDEWADKPLDRIGRTEVELWLRKRIREVAAATANQDLCTLRSLALWAAANGRAPGDLWIRKAEALPLPERIPGNEKPLRTLQRDYCAAFLRTAGGIRPDVVVFLRGMILLGLRPAALAMLRVADAALPRANSAGWLMVPPLKGGRPERQTLEFNTPAHKWLLRAEALRRELSGRKTDSAPAPLLPCRPALGKGGRPAKTNPGGWTTARFDQAFKRLLDHPGIAKIGYGGMAKKDLTPYVFRHSVAEHLADSRDITARALQKFLRHRRVTTQEKYLDRDADAKNDALRAAAEFENIPRGRPAAPADNLILDDLLFDSGEN